MQALQLGCRRYHSDRYSAQTDICELNREQNEIEQVRRHSKLYGVSCVSHESSPTLFGLKDTSALTPNY